MVAFIDDDCIADKNWLKELASSIGNDAGMAGVVLPTKTNLIGKTVSYIGYPGGGLRWYYKFKDKIIKVKRISTCNSLFQKKVLMAVDLFDERLKYGTEDSDLSRKIVKNSYSLTYNPNAIVYHRPRESFTSIFKWFLMRGIADAYSRSLKDKMRLLFSLKSPTLGLIIFLSFIYFLKLYGFILFFFILFLLFLKKIIEYKTPVKEKLVFILAPIILFTMMSAEAIGNIYSLFKKE